MRVYEVIPNLYIRGAFPKSWSQAMVVHGLHEHGIASVLALHPNSDVLEDSDEIEYRYEHMVDRDTLPPLPLLKDCVDWVTERVQDHWSTLVMCRGGKNRSGLVVALVVKNVVRCGGAEAVGIVRAARPIALTNKVFEQYVMTGEIS